MGIKINHLKGDISIDGTGEAPTLGGKPIGSFSGLYVDNKLNSVAVGKDAKATFKGSIAFGYGAETQADYTIAYKVSPNSNVRYTEIFLDGHIPGHVKGGFVYLEGGANPFNVPVDTSVAFTYIAHGREEGHNGKVGYVRLEGVAYNNSGKVEIIEYQQTLVMGSLIQPQLEVIPSTHGIRLGIKRMPKGVVWQVRGQMMHS